jgi:hypothetical protein
LWQHWWFISSSLGSAVSTADVGNKLVGWMLVGAGTLLTYAAVRNRSPWDVLRDIQGQPIAAGFAGSSNVDTSTDPSSFAASIPRVRMVMNREIPPVLVPIRPHGQLDKDAAAGLERAFTILGRVVDNTDSYRSYAEQADAYYNRNETLSDGSLRFGDPNKSAHVVGLAIDLSESNATVSAAMSAAGWQHTRPSAEPWHWSYLIRA